MMWAQRRGIDEKPLLPFKQLHIEAPEGIWGVRISLESNSQILVVGAMQRVCTKICVKKYWDSKSLSEFRPKEMVKVPGDMMAGTFDSTLVKGQGGH